MSSTTEQIKDRLPIEDVVSQYVKLESSGKNLRGKCPFHNERTPSFFVSPERGSYYCFGCGAKGDIFTFVEEFEGLDFKGALKELADKAGIKLEREDPKKVDERQRTYDALEEASNFFEKHLEKEKAVSRYLTDRGLEESTIKEFKLGYAPNEWRSLKDHMTGLGFSEKELEKSGLLVKKDNTSYDRFRGRIMFPIQDPSGRIIAFSGRLYPETEEESKSAKYVNTPETEVFHKSEVLYGYDKAKGHIRRYNFSIIVEGQMDLLMSYQAGYKNTVAGSGTALTRKHFEKINRISPNLVLALDADSAGEMSTTKSAVESLKIGMDLKVARLPQGSDPADVIKEEPLKWKEVIKNAVHIVDFKLSSIVESQKSDREKLKTLTKEVLPFVKAISNKIDQAHFIRKISEAVHVSEDSVYEELYKIENISQENPPENTSARQRQASRSPNDMEERILSFILWQKSKPNPQIVISEYENKFKRITGRKELPNDLSDELIYEAENYFGETDKVEKMLEEMFVHLEKRYLKKEMEKVVLNLKDLEKHGGDSSQYLKKYQDLTKKMVEIENKMVEF